MNITNRYELETENDRLKRQFATAGLDLEAVWYPTPGDPQLENSQLKDLWDWVTAYRACPNQKQLVRQGYRYPPIDPDIDPRSDWLRFERWMLGEPLTWNFVEEHGDLMDPDLLTDCQVAVELDRLVDLLGQRGVCLGMPPSVPEREVYAYLFKELPVTRFDHTGPGTWCVLDGCNGYCEGCFQARWCDIAGELEELTEE
jgi:hypothetical protein